MANITRPFPGVLHVYFMCIDVYFMCISREYTGYPALRHLEEQWMVQMGSLGALDPVQGWNKRDDAKAGARSWGT